MAPQLLIYGATGYSLGLAAAEAKRTGLDFIIGGRTPSKVKALATSLNVPYRIFSPSDSTDAVDQALAGIKVLANGAGPFQLTTDAFMDACIRNRVHYLDISAELYSFDAAIKRDEEAKKAGVMLLPTACSGVECILDCVGGRLLDKVQSPVKLEQVLNINGPLSRGTVATFRSFPSGALKRVDGDLVSHGDGNISFDFRDSRGPLPCFPSSDPQMTTLQRATGLTNFSSYCAKTGGDLPTGDLTEVPEGPSTAERAGLPYAAGFTVTAADGSAVRAVVHMINGYDLTALGTVEAARRILNKEVEAKPGFQTPFLIFGKDYPEAFPGTVVEEY